MAGDSSFSYNEENIVATLARSLFLLAGNKDNHNISDEFEFRPDPTKDCGVSCHRESEKKTHRFIMGEMFGHSSALILIGSSFFQVTSACIKESMSSNFGQTRPLTTDFSVLEHLKNRIMMWPL